MGLRRDTARALSSALGHESRFVDAVAREIELKRIKPKEGARLIIAWYQDRDRLYRMIEHALDT